MRTRTPPMTKVTGARARCFMELQRAKMDDFMKIRSFYDDVIINTNGMEKYAKWKIGSHPTNETIKDYISHGNMYMCMDGRRVIGVMAVPLEQGDDYHPVEWDVQAADDEVASLHIFAVSPEVQGNGLGKPMIRLAMDMARENGMKAFRLDTFATNIPAQKMYESLGFQLKGKQKLYTDNAGWTDFLYYEKKL